MYPKISLVTPNFNYGPTLENTILSVTGQRYRALEYIVLDGGSSDLSVDIIRRHSAEIAYWATRQDSGVYAALNEGFALSSGEIMGWVNSDDVQFPWTLHT